MQTVITPLTTVSTTGPVGTGGDVSQLDFAGDLSVKVRVTSLVCTGTGLSGALLVVEESNNSFASFVPVAVVSVSPGNEQLFSIRKYQIPLCRAGFAGFKWRVNVYYLQPTGNATLSFQAWIDS